MFGMYICFCNPCLEGTPFVFHSHVWFTLLLKVASDDDIISEKRRGMDGPHSLRKK